MLENYRLFLTKKKSERVSYAFLVSFAFNSVWLFLQIYIGNFSSIRSFDLKFMVTSDLSLDTEAFQL